MRSRIFTAFITVYCWTISETVSSIPKFHDYFFYITLISHFQLHLIFAHCFFLLQFVT